MEGNSLPVGGNKDLAALSGELELSTLVKVFGLAPIGVAVTTNGITQYCNPAYLRLFGYDGHEEEIYGKSLLSMVAPEDRPVILAGIEKHLAGGREDTSYEIMGLRRDGTKFPFHVAATIVEIGGKPATVAFFFDLTERRALEESLRDANETLSAIVKACPVPILLVDSRGLIRVWNPAATAAFGWTDLETVGQFNPIVGESDRAEYARNVADALSGGLSGVPAKRMRKDGSVADLEIYAAPVRDALGQATGTVALTVDVTERRRTEEALRRSQEQLLHAQKMDAVGRLAGGVAHDFNNLLMVVSGLTELLSRRVTDDGAEHYFSEMRSALTRAGTLTRQLLAFSRMQRLSPTVMDVNAVVAGMRGMLEALGGASVRLVLDLGDGLWRTRADVSQIEQVVANLSVNARDAMSEGGRLEISTRNVELDARLQGERFPVPPGRYVRLAVTDTGCGMTDQVLAHLCEPFFTTKERGKGTGLGLSTVHGIAQQSGGHLHVESRLGSGSTFSIYLPRVIEDGTLDEDRPAETRPRKLGTVVLVDDDERVRRLVRELLEGRGHTVLEAGSPAHAVELVRASRGKERILLSDVVMPEVSGSELAERLWAEEPDLPVVFMTGFADAETLPPRVRERAVELLSKPFDAVMLFGGVERAMRVASERELSSGKSHDLDQNQ